MVEDHLQRTGWSAKRCVVSVHRRIRNGLARQSPDTSGQLRLTLAEDAVLDADAMWEYTVLLTDISYPLEAIAQLYRDRFDCENGFDELKNQWWLGGFTTQDMARCQTTARAGALVYNWWPWYCRAAHPGARLEALTRRPRLLAAVGRTSSHAGQTQLYLTPLHAKADTIKALVVNIRAALRHAARSAKQFPKLDRWRKLLHYICARITASAPLQCKPVPAIATG